MTGRLQDKPPPIADIISGRAQRTANDIFLITQVADDRVAQIDNVDDGNWMS